MAAILTSTLVSSVFYATMPFLPESVLWDTITALGVMICFSYSITSFASVWYFRRQWFVSPANTFNQLVAPLIGGILLGALFCTTIVDSMDPAFGSGSQVDGIGLVFILGMGIIEIEEHTSELQSLMRISYAVFCLKKQINHLNNT